MSKSMKICCCLGILRLSTKTSAWQKKEAWRSWQGAKSLADTGSMRWLGTNHQPRSDLNTSPSPSGQCRMKQPCGPRCLSTPGLPWWPNSAEPSAFFLASLLWLFGVASRSCYPFCGPDMDHRINTPLVHSTHITWEDVIHCSSGYFLSENQVSNHILWHSRHSSKIWSFQYLLRCGIYSHYTQVYSEQNTASG